MKSLFEMLQAIFGKNIISRTIGTRTNVIKLPTNKSSPLKNEFDVVRSAENPQVFEKLKKVIEDEAPYISRMNDAERLIYEGNVKRLHDYLVSIGEIKPTITAEVVGLTTKEPISGKGLESLVEEAGQTSPPGTLIGDIQSRINRLKNLAKEEGTTMQGVVEDFASGQKGMLKLRDEGLVRSTARQIMFNDIKSGKLKVSKEVQDIVSGRASGDPIDSFRTIYGEDALEQLDSLTPDLRQLRTEVEAEKLARSKFKFEPKLDRPKESYTPEEMEKILKEGEEEGSKGLDYLTGQEPPEKKATGGRVGFALGTTYKVLSKNLNDSVPIGLMLPADALPNETYVEYFLRKRAEQTPAITSISSSPPPVTTPVVRPEDEILMRYREYMNTSKPSQSDLENKYREFVQGKADGGRIGFKSGSGGKKILDLISKTKKPIKEFTDDEMMAYIKKYKEEGPTLEEFTKKINAETGSNFTPEQLAHAYRVKVAYPHSTPIVDSQGKFIGGGLYNPPLDVSISDRETLTGSIMKTRKAKGLDVPKKEIETTEIVDTTETLPKAGEGRFTKQQVLEKIIQKTIETNPTDEYVQKTFPNFIKEIRAKPELANDENVWKTFTQDFPENKRLVVYGDDTVDFFTKGENLPEGMRQTQELADTYGISMQEASRIKQMEPTDQVMEIKKLEVLKKRTENAKGGRIGYAGGSDEMGPSPIYQKEYVPSITLDSHDKAPGNMDKYPVKVGNLELGIMGAMSSGKSNPNPYVKVNTADRNVSVRGKYNVPDTGISLLGDVGDIRSRSRADIDVPQYNYKESIRDVMRLNPYSVGIEYAPDQNRNINLRYDDQGNVSLRGEYKFAKGGLGYLIGE